MGQYPAFVVAQVVQQAVLLGRQADGLAVAGDGSRIEVDLQACRLIQVGVP